MTTRLSALTAGRRHSKPRTRTVIVNEIPAGTDHGAGIAHTEHGEQVSLIAWAKENEAKWPELRWLFAIPNGGLRAKATARKLQLEGVKPGVSDLFLPAPRGGHHGLWIEMKAWPNQPTGLQRRFQSDMRTTHYAAVVCWSFEGARNLIIGYLGGVFILGENAPPMEIH